MQNLSIQPNVRFLDPEKLLFQAGLSAGHIVADLGAGNGFYAIASAKAVGPTGIVWAVDILEEVLGFIASDARLHNLKNIQTLRADLELPNSCLSIPAGSCDLVILASVVHQLKNKSSLFTEAYRILKTGGKVLIVEWNNKPSPFGPAMVSRISENDVNEQAIKGHLKLAGEIASDPYHYSLVFIK